MEQDKVQKILPVNSKVKDTFFKTVYRSNERLKGLAQFLLGIPDGEVCIKNVRPVVFGSRENDLSFLYDNFIYFMMEEEASICPNMPYRLLEYITAGLRSTVDSEKILYSSRRVYFPVPKLYMVQTGIEEKLQGITIVRYDMRLSDFYKSYEGKPETVPEPDLEAVVHVYDFRMTLVEVLDYIENGTIPERLRDYTGDLLDYALVADSLTYIQRVGKNKKYVFPENVSGPEELLELLKSRGIFVDLLSDREVCNMTMATFSREEIREYQGWERGLEEGREEGREEGLIKQLVMQVVKKLHKNKPVDTIADELEEEPEVIRRICLAAEACAPEYDVDEICARLINL